MGKARKRTSGNPATRRQEQIAKVQREAKRAERRRTGLMLLAALVVAAVIIGVGVLANKSDNDSAANDVGSPTADAPASDPASASTGASLAEVKTYKESANHVSGPLTYAQNPPAGGNHNPIWLNCGVYDKPVPNENAVHDLEHGAVWITYRPNLPAADVAALRNAIPGTYVVLSPYPGLSAPVVASAWGKQLKLTGASDPRLGAFIQAYWQGPQTPEPGSACTGGSDGTLPLDYAGGMSKP